MCFYELLPLSTSPEWLTVCVCVCVFDLADTFNFFMCRALTAAWENILQAQQCLLAPSDQEATPEYVRYSAGAFTPHLPCPYTDRVLVTTGEGACENKKAF